MRGSVAMRVVVVALLAAACGERDEPRFEPQAPAREVRAPEVAPATVAERVAARIAETAPGHRVVVRDATHLEIDGAPVDLANLAGECREASACDAAVARGARALTTEEAVLTREGLRAVILPGAIVEEQRARARAEGLPEPFVGRPFVGPLWEVFAHDSPDAISYFGAVARAELGSPTLDELHELALSNMRAAFDEAIPSEPFDEEIAPAVRVVRTGDSYANSRVLLHERWAPIAREVRGELLVAAPTRDLVVYTGSADDFDVATIRWLVQQMFRNEPHPISPAILRRTADGWALFHANDREDPAVVERIQRGR